MKQKLNVLVAANSFKGCADAFSASAIYKNALEFVRPSSRFDFRIKELPICDGGVGFVEIMTQALKGQIQTASCVGPRFGPLEAKWGFVSSEHKAIIEVAETAGYGLLVGKDRNPTHTSSFGVGQNIRTAIEYGSKSILIGCGDTAITDCGIGMLSALGVKFRDENSVEIERPVGQDLIRIATIDASQSILNDYDGHFEVACNLSSIARGPESTAYVYSMQKGATLQEAQALAEGIESFCALTEKQFGKSQLGILPGTGSAGGIGFALAAFGRSTLLRYSFDVVFSQIDLSHHLQWADVTITGEGLFDRNSIKGKAPVALALKSKRYDTKAIGIVGSIESGIHSKILRSGFDFLEPMSDASINLNHYIKNFDQLLFDATVRAMIKYENRK